MERQLTDLTFQDWVVHNFDHEVRDPAWHFEFDADYWEGPSRVTVDYLTRLFRGPVAALAGYDDAQLNEGLWYLAGTSEYMFSLRDPVVEQDLRVACVASFSDLFAQLFAPRCTAHSSLLDEPDASPLNDICYMWWEILPLNGDPGNAAQKDIDQAALKVMASCLELDSIACQESALHGLGHWHLDYPDYAQDTIDGFLARNPFCDKRLRDYALAARLGSVL